MDKTTHGRLLRTAMAQHRLSSSTVADAVGVSSRTVGNWRTGATMPSEADLLALRKLLGSYDEDAGTDEVEAAVRRSALLKWRQDAVISTYERHVYEQGESQGVTA